MCERLCNKIYDVFFHRPSGITNLEALTTFLDSVAEGEVGAKDAYDGGLEIC